MQRLPCICCTMKGPAAAHLGSGLMGGTALKSGPWAKLHKHAPARQPGKESHVRSRGSTYTHCSGELVMHEWEIPFTSRQRWERGNHSISQVKKHVQDWGTHAELIPAWCQMLHSCTICSLPCQQGKMWSSPFHTPYSLTEHK